MDAPTIIHQLRESGPIVFVLLSAAILSLIWEWTANSRREEACRDCHDCKRRRAEIVVEKRREFARKKRRCPYDAAYLPPDGNCPFCQTKWW